MAGEGMSVLAGGSQFNTIFLFIMLLLLTNKLMPIILLKSFSYMLQSKKNEQLLLKDYFIMQI